VGRTRSQKVRIREAEILEFDFPKFAALLLLQAYKRAVSPFLPTACRYVPTCSEYAMEAIERYGVLRGGWMAFARVMRCHPLAGSGYDPVVRRASEKIPI
jgi:uncharacterized protein